mmetsp:Transcript_3712/g.15444  ORF Transcript_3712/g.15444 Transcript_3712/m.15444 type:complete len:321 (+) Transcript_3712:1107-2069(+)
MPLDARGRRPPLPAALPPGPSERWSRCCERPAPQQWQLRPSPRQRQRGRPQSLPTLSPRATATREGRSRQAPPAALPRTRRTPQHRPPPRCSRQSPPSAGCTRPAPAARTTERFRRLPRAREGCPDRLAARPPRPPQPPPAPASTARQRRRRRQAPRKEPVRTAPRRSPAPRPRPRQRGGTCDRPRPTRGRTSWLAAEPPLMRWTAQPPPRRPRRPRQLTWPPSRRWRQRPATPASPSRPGTRPRRRPSHRPEPAPPPLGRQSHLRKGRRSTARAAPPRRPGPREAWLWTERRRRPRRRRRPLSATRSPPRRPPRRPREA